MAVNLQPGAIGLIYSPGQTWDLDIYFLDAFDAPFAIGTRKVTAVIESNGVVLETMTAGSGLTIANNNIKLVKDVTALTVTGSTAAYDPKFDNIAIGQFKVTLMWENAGKDQPLMIFLIDVNADVQEREAGMSSSALGIMLNISSTQVTYRLKELSDSITEEIISTRNISKDAKIIKDWEARGYLQEAQVLYIDGIIYEANTETLSTDIPSISSKWTAKNDTYLYRVLRVIEGIKLSGINFEKGRFANGNGFNSETVDWCIRTVNYFSATTGNYYVRVKSGFRISIVESTMGSIYTAADASLTSNTYVSSLLISSTKPFIRLQITKWNETENTIDTSYVFDLSNQNYLNFVQILKEKDRVSEIEDNLTQEIVYRKNADIAVNTSISGLTTDNTKIKNVAGIVISQIINAYSFNSQNSNVNNQKTLTNPLEAGKKYNLYIKSNSPLGQALYKVILYWNGNTQSQVIGTTNTNDLSKGYNIPFVASGAIDYVNIQLTTVTNTGINVDVTISVAEQTEARTFKNDKAYPFANVGFDTNSNLIRNLIKDVKLVGSGWNYSDKWCFRIFRKNTSTNFLLGLYKSYGNDGFGSIIEDGTNVSIAFPDIDSNKTTGIQKVWKSVDSNRTIYLELDMSVYATLSVFQLDLNYVQTGIHKDSYVNNLMPYFGSNLTTDKPIITIIDDDGNQSFMSWMKGVLDAYGYKAGIGVTTDWVGTAGFMTISDLQAMKTAGHEIMCHTKSHASSIWYPSAWTTTGYNQDLIESEMKLSRKWLLDNGFGLVEHLIYAGGGYDGVVNKPYRLLTIESAQKYYRSALSTVAGINSNKVLDNYMLNRVNINKSVNNLAYYTNLIDSCKANCGWLILFTHSNTSSEVDASFLDSILSYVQSSGVSVMKYTDAYAIKKNKANVGALEQGNLHIGRDGGIS